MAAVIMSDQVENREMFVYVLILAFMGQFTQIKKETKRCDLGLRFEISDLTPSGRKGNRTSSTRSRHTGRVYEKGKEALRYT